MRRTIVVATGLAAVLGTAHTALALQAFSLDWFTIDAGGAVFITGGDFEVSVTIGQPDASLPITGGSFELTGGFWPAVGDGRRRPPQTPSQGDTDGASDLDDLSRIPPP